MLKLKTVKENFSSINPQGTESKAHRLWKWLMDNGPKSREEIYQFDKSYSTVLAKYFRNGLVKQDNDSKYSANKDYRFEDIKLIDNKNLDSILNTNKILSKPVKDLDSIKFCGYEWTKIGEIDGKPLYLCNNSVADMEFPKKDLKNWKNSNIRNWLNSNFYNSLPEEKEIIDTYNGDKLFLLSGDEFKKFKNKIPIVYDIDNSSWWLRTGEFISNNTFNGTGFRCVRPAFLVKPSKRAELANSQNELLKSKIDALMKKVKKYKNLYKDNWSSIRRNADLFYSISENLNDLQNEAEGLGINNKIIQLIEEMGDSAFNIADHLGDGYWD